MWKLEDAVLCHDGRPIFAQATGIAGLQQDGTDGAYLCLRAQTAANEAVCDLGTMPGLVRFMGGHRSVPLFMAHENGRQIGDVHEETLFLLVEMQDGSFVLLLPLFDERSRAALGQRDGHLAAVCVTGCEKTTDGGELMYILCGDDPYTLMDTAARSLREHLRTFRLREEKALPTYFRYLGWCTWDAFYFDVDAEKLLSGLRELRADGIPVASVILDDGWLTTTDGDPIGSRRLTAFEANAEKFPHGLAETVQEAKARYGIACFMVWHASMGYWAGVDMPMYRGADGAAHFPAAVDGYADALNEKFLHHPLRAEAAEKFYDRFYAELAAAGVDGTKIDVQYLIEALSEQAGGRCVAMQVYHRAIERAVHRHFADNALNCMSCSNDMVYRMTDTNAVRSGNDFMPKVRNYGSIVSNMYNNYWLAPFTWADHDMFWSGKPEARIEAIARVIGGAAVYVSDRPGEHDAPLLQSLCTADGRVLRPVGVGRPTRDCLMADPLRDGTLLRVSNRNAEALLLAVFNFSSVESLKCQLSPKDVITSDDRSVDARFALSRSGAEDVTVIGARDCVTVEIAPESAELYAFAPIHNGIAVLGLAGKLNGSAAVERWHFAAGGLCAEVMEQGIYRFYAEICPERVVINGKTVPFALDKGILTAEYH